MTLKTQILRALNGASAPMTTAELADQLDAPKPSIRRTRMQMENTGLIIAVDFEPLRFKLSSEGRAAAAFAG